MRFNQRAPALTLGALIAILVLLTSEALGHPHSTWIEESQTGESFSAAGMERSYSTEDALHDPMAGARGDLTGGSSRIHGPAGPGIALRGNLIEGMVLDKYARFRHSLNSP